MVINAFMLDVSINHDRIFSIEKGFNKLLHDSVCNLMNKSYGDT